MIVKVFFKNLQQECSIGDWPNLVLWYTMSLKEVHLHMCNMERYPG